MTIENGKAAPTFTLPSSNGEEVSLESFRNKNSGVLYFYPKDNTPGCTNEACDFRDRADELKKAGVVVLGVSPDPPASHQRFAAKHALPFPLLSDPERKVLEAYGAWGEKTTYGKRTQGVVRSTVLVDSKGRVARHWPKVKVKGHAEEVLEAARLLK